MDKGRRELSEEVAGKKHRATKKAQTKNDVVLVTELGIRRQRRVDDVREVRLVADMDETEQSERFVPRIIAIVNEEILEALQ